MLKGIHFLLFICLLGLLLGSCRKNTSSEKQQPCPGWCGVPDFSILDYQPAWSPSGKHIAYYHIDKEISKNGIYLIKPDGSENRLWHRGVGAETPTWSPDGQWIAFSEGAQIWKKKLNGDSLIQITNSGRNFFPAWSPDGKWIAYGQSICNVSNACGLWIVAIDGEKTTFLINYGNFPAWDPKNMEILYQTRLVQSNGHVLGDSLWSYNLGSGLKKPLTILTGNNYSNNYFKYSIDNKIAFTSQPQNGSPQIWVMHADGTNQKQLTQTGGYTADWSPDGNKIVYTDSRAVNGRLWIMDAYGTDKHQLTFKENF